jgi:hypothetical protein
MLTISMECILKYAYVTMQSLSGRQLIGMYVARRQYHIPTREEPQRAPRASRKKMSLDIMVIKQWYLDLPQTKTHILPHHSGIETKKENIRYVDNCNENIQDILR